MPTGARSKIHVRRLEVADFSFVRDLAAKQSNFTIPPPYVLWLLLKIKGDICLVAEHDTYGPVAYLLAVPVESPPASVYIWQLASSDRGKRYKAAYELMVELRKLTRALGTRSVIFSALPGSAAYRAVRRYARELASSNAELTTVLPTIVAPGEHEFRVDLN